MRIKEILQQKGMTCKELAELIGMTPTGLSLAMSEDGNPPLKRLRQIASVLGVELRDLFDDSPLMETINCPKCGAEIKVAITRVQLNAVSGKQLTGEDKEDK